MLNLDKQVVFWQYQAKVEVKVILEAEFRMAMVVAEKVLLLYLFLFQDVILIPRMTKIDDIRYEPTWTFYCLSLTHQILLLLPSKSVGKFKNHYFLCTLYKSHNYVTRADNLTYLFNKQLKFTLWIKISIPQIFSRTFLRLL